MALIAPTLIVVVESGVTVRYAPVRGVVLSEKVVGNGTLRRHSTVVPFTVAADSMVGEL